MTIASIGSSKSLPMERAASVSSRKDDAGSYADAPGLGTRRSPDASSAGTTAHPNYLISAGAERLVALLEAAPDPGEGSLMSYSQLVAREIRKTVGSSLPYKEGDPNYFTQADVDLIKRMTGYNYIVMESGTTVLDDDGNPPVGEGKDAQRLAAYIGLGRAIGQFKGEVTGDFLKALFERLSDAKEPLPSEWLKKALDFTG